MKTYVSELNKWRSDAMAQFERTLQELPTTALQ
jgi:hypothetical protein